MYAIERLLMTHPNRSALLVISMLALGAAVAPASASDPASRHVQASYALPTSVRGVSYNDAEIQFTTYGSAKALLHSADRYATVEVLDRTGVPVPFLLSEDLNGSGGGSWDLGEFCGRSTKVRLRPAVSLMVYLEVGTCAGRPASATTGTANFTFDAR